MKYLIAFVLVCAPVSGQDCWPVFPVDGVYAPFGEAVVSGDVFFDFQAPNENLTATCTAPMYGVPWACTAIWWNLKVRDDVFVVPEPGPWAQALNGGQGPELWLVFDPPFEPLTHPGELWTYYLMVFDATQPIDQVPTQTGLIQGLFNFNVFMDNPGTYELNVPSDVIIRPVVQPGGSTLEHQSSAGWAYTTLPPVGCNVASKIDPGQEDYVTIAYRTFKRGDVDGGGSLSIGDPLTLLDYLFQGGKAPPCLMAADSDDSDSLSLSDVVFLLSYLFKGGAQPPAPFPHCGPDPQDVTVPSPALTCLSGCVP